MPQHSEDHHYFSVEALASTPIRLEEKSTCSGFSIDQLLSPTFVNSSAKSSRREAVTEHSFYPTSPSCLPPSLMRVHDSPAIVKPACAAAAVTAMRHYEHFLTPMTSSSPLFYKVSSTRCAAGSRRKLPSHHHHHQHTAAPLPTSAPYKCNICQESQQQQQQHGFAQLSSLNEHFLIHHLHLLHQVSGAYLRNKEVLRNQFHKLLTKNVPVGAANSSGGNLHHSAATDGLRTLDGRYRCPLCGLSVKWPTELEKHVMVHTEERPFVCVVCGLGYKWGWDLARHFEKKHERDLHYNPYRRDNK